MCGPPDFESINPLKIYLMHHLASFYPSIAFSFVPLKGARFIEEGVDQSVDKLQMASCYDITIKLNQPHDIKSKAGHGCYIK